MEVRYWPIAPVVKCWSAVTWPSLLLSPRDIVIRDFERSLVVELPDNDLLACLPVLTDEEKHQRTLAGLADVDAGRTIPDEEMKAWARSLLNQAKSTK